MVGKKRKRISIAPLNETIERVDLLAEKYGLPRSQMIVFLLNQGLESYDRQGMVTDKSVEKYRV